MIQAFTESTIIGYISTLDNRIDTSVDISNIRYLVKFINDMDGSISYAYSDNTTYLERFTKLGFFYNLTPNVYESKVNLLPAGHWKYEVYEVSWIGTPDVSSGSAPSTETDVLPVRIDNGVVQGIVTKGILNLTERVGTEQVQYTEHESPEGTNTIYYGQ